MRLWTAPSRSAWILHGDGSAGIHVTIGWVAGEAVHGTTKQYADSAGARGGSYRTCPLMRVLGPPKTVEDPEPLGTCIVVGRARVAVLPPAAATVTLSLDGIWSKVEADDVDGEWTHVPARAWGSREHRDELVRALAEPAHDFDLLEPDAIATVIAKGIAEGSRNAMSAIRDIRYDLEESLTKGMGHKVDRDPAPDRPPPDLEVVLANLIELRRAISRVRDLAREGVRTVLATHGTSPEAYHAYRVFRDPTRVVESKRRLTQKELLDLPWVSALDAGVRHCERLNEGLKDEVELISGLLSASATIAGAREAEAQGTFNTLAAAVAVGFGLPALILALYGIDSHPAPLGDGNVALLFIPLAGALLLAGLVPRMSPHSTISTSRLLGICALAFFVLLAAGLVGTKP